MKQGIRIYESVVDLSNALGYYAVHNGRSTDLSRSEPAEAYATRSLQAVHVIAFIWLHFCTMSAPTVRLLHICNDLRTSPWVHDLQSAFSTGCLCCCNCLPHYGTVTAARILPLLNCDLAMRALSNLRDYYHW
jgi:hypothetical protein